MSHGEGRCRWWILGFLPAGLLLVDGFQAPCTNGLVGLQYGQQGWTRARGAVDMVNILDLRRMPLINRIRGGSNRGATQVKPVAPSEDKKDAPSTPRPTFTETQPVIVKESELTPAWAEPKTPITSTYTPPTTVAPVAPKAALPKVSSAEEEEPVELPENVENFMTEPLKDDRATVQAASAVLGAILGFIVGGPVVALVGAVLTTYSCTADNDAGDSARGGGKWAIGVYNFWTKLNSKYAFVAKMSKASVGLYRRFKKDLPDKEPIEQVEKQLSRAIEVTADASAKYEVPRRVGDVLYKTGELSVAAARAVIDVNQQYQLTDKLMSWLQREVIVPMQQRRAQEDEMLRKALQEKQLQQAQPKRPRVKVT